MHDSRGVLFWTLLDKEPRFNICWEKSQPSKEFQESDLPPSSPKFDEMLPMLKEPLVVHVEDAEQTNCFSESQVVPSLETSERTSFTGYSTVSTIAPNMNSFQSEDDQVVCGGTSDKSFSKSFLRMDSISAEHCEGHNEANEQVTEDLQIYLPPELSPTPLDKLYSTFPYTPEERIFQFPYLDETGEVNNHTDLTPRGVKDHQSQQIHRDCYSDQESPEPMTVNAFQSMEELQNVPESAVTRASDNFIQHNRQNVVLLPRSVLIARTNTKTKVNQAEQSNDLSVRLGLGNQVEDYGGKREFVRKALTQLNNHNRNVVLDENTRLSHNDVERQRRNEMKGRFDSLKSVVPEIAGVDRTPKILILRKAKEFINELHSEEKRLDDEKKYERERNRLLLEKLVKLTGSGK